MQTLLVFQSLWVMERLRSETRELTLAEKVGRAAAAGFDGVTDHFFTMGLRDAFPALNFTVDLLHYVVRDIYLPIKNDIEAMISRIRDHGRAMYGRVARPRQVQLELSFP